MFLHYRISWNKKMKPPPPAQPVSISSLVRESQRSFPVGCQQIWSYMATQHVLFNSLVKKQQKFMQWDGCHPAGRQSFVLKKHSRENSSKEQIQLLAPIPVWNYACDFLVSEKASMNAVVTCLFGWQKPFTWSLHLWLTWFGRCFCASVLH